MAEYDVRLAPGGQEDGAEEHLRSLLSWLREDENLDRAVHGSLSGTAARSTEDMGTGLDLVALVAGSALSTGSLVFSVLQWQAARRRAPALVVRRGSVEVHLPAGRTVDAEELRRLVSMLGEDDRQSQEPAGDDGTS
ncbi:hypothetical protein ACIQM3_31495 [Streptomyces sp. NPDC091271]|uniref:effector-associated constant component EACC1 n=1 Tax=Streptomyces sp. NPDC091271 TaxID=3365980 RepID=UPI0037FD8FE4